MLGCHGLPTSGAELPCCAILVGTNCEVDLGTVFGPGSPQCLWSLLCDPGKLFVPITILVKLKRQLSGIVIDQKRALVLLPPDKGSSFSHLVNFCQNMKGNEKFCFYHKTLFWQDEPCPTGKYCKYDILANIAKRQKDPTITESLKATFFQIFGRKAPRSITSQKTLKYSANSVSSGTN